MCDNKKGMNFMDGLLLGFILLKIAGLIDWSWWWVLSPIWISAIIALLVVIWERIGRC